MPNGIIYISNTDWKRKRAQYSRWELRDVIASLKHYLVMVLVEFVAIFFVVSQALFEPIFRCLIFSALSSHKKSTNLRSTSRKSQL